MDNNQQIRLTDEQMQVGARAGMQFLNLESTLIPGNIKSQLAVLEMFLNGIAQGQLKVVSADQLAVKSQATGSAAVTDGIQKAIGAENAKPYRERAPEESGYGSDGEKGRPETGDGIRDRERGTTPG